MAINYVKAPAARVDYVHPHRARTLTRVAPAGQPVTLHRGESVNLRTREVTRTVIGRGA